MTWQSCRLGLSVAQDSLQHNEHPGCESITSQTSSQVPGPCRSGSGDCSRCSNEKLWQRLHTGLTKRMRSTAQHRFASAPALASRVAQEVPAPLFHGISYRTSATVHTQASKQCPMLLFRKPAAFVHLTALMMELLRPSCRSCLSGCCLGFKTSVNFNSEVCGRDTKLLKVSLRLFS